MVCNIPGEGELKGQIEVGNKVAPSLMMRHHCSAGFSGD